MESEKKSYLQKLADKMIELDKKLEELKVQGAEASVILKEDYAKVAEELKVKKKEAEEKLNEIKKGAEKAFGELSTAFDSALSKFKKPQA